MTDQLSNPTLLPSDFALTEERRQCAREEFVPEGAIEHQFVQFTAFYGLRDDKLSNCWDLVWAYWCNAAGQAYDIARADGFDQPVPNELAEEWREWALSAGIPADEIDRQFDHFFNFYLSEDRDDWFAAWRFWMRALPIQASWGVTRAQRRA